MRGRLEFSGQDDHPVTARDENARFGFQVNDGDRHAARVAPGRKGL
jgi:hypothetical protein